MRPWTADEWERAAQRQWADAQDETRATGSAARAQLSCTDALARAIAAHLSEYELDVRTGTAVHDPAAPDIGRVMPLLLPWHDNTEVLLPVLPPSHRGWQVYRARPGGHYGHLSELHEPLAQVPLPQEADWLPARETAAGVLDSAPHLTDLAG